MLGVDLAPQLLLEPRLAGSWSAQRKPGDEPGNGLTDVEASRGLRRSVDERLNVVAGIIHARLLGLTRSIAGAAGDPS